MPYCYYTCNLIPAAFLSRSGYEPRWFGTLALDTELAGRFDSPNVHPMTCPFVTRLVTAAERLLAEGSAEDRVVVPGGCDAMRRAGDLLASAYPRQVTTFRLPRFSDDGALRELTQELERLEQWLGGPAESREERPGPANGHPLEPGTKDGVTEDAQARSALSGPGVRCTDHPRGFDLPSAPRPGGVFVIGGPLSDDSLLRFILRLGSHISGVESCTAPSRWQALDGPRSSPAYEETARLILSAGVCPRRSSVDRRAYLAQRMTEARPSSVIYARQSFCDPGAYDALLVADMAEKQGLPFLEVEVGFPLEISGPLRTRVEAFLEAQLLDDDLLDDLDDLDDMDDDLVDDDLQDDLRDDFGDPVGDDIADEDATNDEDDLAGEDFMDGDDLKREEG